MNLGLKNELNFRQIRKDFEVSAKTDNDNFFQLKSKSDPYRIEEDLCCEKRKIVPG